LKIHGQGVGLHGLNQIHHGEGNGHANLRILSVHGDGAAQCHDPTSLMLRGKEKIGTNSFSAFKSNIKNASNDSSMKASYMF